LGENVPDCLFPVIKQARYLNPHQDIYLLTDQKTFFEKQGGFFEIERVVLIDTAPIPLSKEHQIFLDVNPIERSSSSGLWYYATERFFTLFDFIQSRNLKNIIHLENDSMLYIDVDELQFPSQLAAPFQSMVGCIPCFLFTKDAESLRLLLAHIISEIINYKGVRPNVYLNDMQTLASYYRKFGADYLLPLPTLMPEYRYLKRKSIFAPDNQTPLSFLWAHGDLFPGYIFDAAGLGIYLNGNDRKLSPGHGSGTIHSRSLFDPGHFSFFWGEDQKGKKVPFLSFKGKNYRIVNLHFHSKMPEEYTSFPKQEQKPKYFIAIKKNGENRNLEEYTPFLPPAGKFYADPFLIKRDGVNYLFFEEYNGQKGVISYVTVEGEGKVSQPRLALELPTHLSFPSLFQEGDDIYMVPETYRYKSVSLYKSVAFPDQWQRKRELIRGERFSDPLLFKHNGYYWLFVTTHMDQLSIYYAKSLGAKFLPHPINRRRIKGRNAGPLFTFEGRMIRPTMDCSQRYGKSMILKEIVLLTPEEFIEKEFALIEPTWAPGLVGTHTYCQGEDYLVYDGEL
jgi:hypothetical protein